jgi:hypothetical protein
VAERKCILAGCDVVGKDAAQPFQMTHQRAVTTRGLANRRIPRRNGSSGGIAAASVG